MEYSKWGNCNNFPTPQDKYASIVMLFIELWRNDSKKKLINTKKTTMTKELFPYYSDLSQIYIN